MIYLFISSALLSGNTFGNVFFIDHNIDHRVISRCIKGNILKKILNYCVQTPRTDILTGFVCVESRFRNGAESLLFELDSDIIRFKQCGILFCYCVLRSGQYPLVIIRCERIELHNDRKTPLKLRNQVVYLRNMERTRCDKQHIVRAHRAVFG